VELHKISRKERKEEAEGHAELAFFALFANFARDSSSVRPWRAMASVE
jgi:hypothetical protein